MLEVFIFVMWNCHHYELAETLMHSLLTFSNWHGLELTSQSIFWVALRYTLKQKWNSIPRKRHALADRKGQPHWSLFPHKFQTLGQLLKQFWHWSFDHLFHRKRARIVVKLTDAHSSGSSLDFSVNESRKRGLHWFSSRQEGVSSWADAHKCSRKPE